VQAARRAGIEQAAVATRVRSSTTAKKVSGSVAVVLNSRLASKRVSASAPNVPANSPAHTMTKPWRGTRTRTCEGSDPSATRTPISYVRVACGVGHYQRMPTAVKGSATIASLLATRCESGVALPRRPSTDRAWLLVRPVAAGRV